MKPETTEEQVVEEFFAELPADQVTKQKHPLESTVEVLERAFSTLANEPTS